MYPTHKLSKNPKHVIVGNREILLVYFLGDVQNITKLIKVSLWSDRKSGWVIKVPAA